MPLENRGGRFGLGKRVLVVAAFIQSPTVMAQYLPLALVAQHMARLVG